MDKNFAFLAFAVVVGMVGLVFGFKPSADNLFQLAGAFVGSFFAVAGAVWATGVREKRRARALSEAVAARYHNVRICLIKFPLLVSKKPQSYREQLRDLSNDLAFRCEDFSRYVDEYAPVFVEVGPSAILNRSLVLQCTSYIKEVAEKLAKNQQTRGDDDLAGLNLSGVISELLKFDQAILKQIANIRS